jgi:hypothetical protein
VKTKFNIGDRVDKVRGYQFPSTIVAVYWTTGGELRYVAELDNLGLQHIFNEEQLKHQPNTP